MKLANGLTYPDWSNVDVVNLFNNLKPAAVVN